VDFGITQENPVPDFQTPQGSNHLRVDSYGLGLQRGQSLVDQKKDRLKVLSVLPQAV
jgi:hypothetical protein